MNKILNIIILLYGLIWIIPLWCIALLYKIYFMLACVLVYPITVLLKIKNIDLTIPKSIEIIDDWFYNLLKR